VTIYLGKPASWGKKEGKERERGSVYLDRKKAPYGNQEVRE